MPVRTPARLRAILKSSASFNWKIAASRMGLILAVPLFAVPAMANPLGSAVTSGSASVSTSTNKTQINQKSEDVVIDWSSFNIGSGQTTQFVQPNAQAIAVNRIGGNAPSQIFGTLDANGRVVLINGNGMLFGKGSQVNVGALVATSSGGTDANLPSGKFTQAGNRNASIVNQGSITTRQGGFVALVAPNVTNSGTVTAKLGTVSLAGANAFTIDLAGDGLVSFAAPDAGPSSVTNTGALSGAAVLLTAGAAEGVATGVVNVSGTIVAQGTHDRGGTIILDAGDGGDIAVSNAALNASGAKGGGSITIGGWNENSVTVDKASTLNASAIDSGNGGNISVVSATTSFEGQARAQGGKLSGNGGTIETSGHVLDFAGASIDASAARGKDGQWILDPYDLTIDSAAAATIDGTLNSGTGVTLQTTASGASGPGNPNPSGNGDIFIDSAISWGTTATLTLSAYRNIDFNASVTASGGGSLSLTTGTGTTGSYFISAGDSISFTGASTLGSTLTINGAPYKLLYNMTQVQNINASGATLGKDYALAKSLNASSTTNWIPIGTSNGVNVFDSGCGCFETGGETGFSGIFEGLGNTISGLNVTVTPLVIDNDGVITSRGYAGFFGWSTGTIRDIGLIGGSTTLTIESLNGNPVHSGDNFTGALVGFSGNTGFIINAYATGGSVSGDFGVGGLAGGSGYSITSSYANESVVGFQEVGGLIGDNGGQVSSSFAEGSVGGFVYVGGLVGESFTNGSFPYAVSDSYATGTVTGNQYVGGLVGALWAGSVTGSYATGAVTGVYEDSQGASAIGGLAGLSGGAGAASIANSYSTGSVSGGMGSSEIGGLVGWNNNADTITDSYATGAVSGTSDVGGLTGYNAGTVTDGYYNAGTTGQPLGTQSDGSIGLTTAQLQGVLQTGFSNSVWSTGTGLYPYLQWQYPSGTPQAISGYAYSDSGVTPLAAQIVSGLVNGTSIGNVSTGANGYYYLLVAPGTISGSGSAVLAYADNQGYANGATLENATGSLANFDIWGNTLIAPTADTTYGTAKAKTLQNQDPALISQAVGSNSTAASLVAGLSEYGYIATGSGFTINQPATLSNGLYVQTTASGANITVADALTLPGSEGLTLAANASVLVDAPITVSGAGNVTLTTDLGGAGGDYSFDLGPTGFAGSLSFTGTPDSGQALTINGAQYTLLYSMSDITNIDNNLAGNYALAVSLDATGTTYTTGLVGSGVGPNGDAFSGIFSGLGNTISNLSINGGGHDTGLFALSTGTIRDIGLLAGSTGSITNGGGVSTTGSLVGTLAGDGSVLNSYSTLAVTGQSTVGGLVGAMATTGSIANSYETGTVTGGSNDWNIGGLVGAESGGGTISNSYATGSVIGVNASYDIGGLVGYAAGGSIIINSYATGSVGDDLFQGSVVGGLVGEGDGIIIDSHETGTVNGEVLSNDVGGLVGEVNGPNGGVDTSITGSWATGAVNAGSRSNNIGGLVGLVSGGGTATMVPITDSWATGAVSSGTIGSTPGGDDIGGLVGIMQYSSLTNVYSTGSVTVGSATGSGYTFCSGTATCVGGLVGYMSAGSSISNAYSTGAINVGTNGSYVGGLVGDTNTYDETITNAYATGAVNVAAGASFVGGFLGGVYGNNFLSESITDAYATGAVTVGIDNSYVGGFVGGLFPDSGYSITSSYYDAGTTGQALGPQADGSVGLTTAQLQSVLPSGFSGSTWGTGPGLYPYLLTQYPGGTPQAISGYAFGDSGLTPLAEQTVDGMITGKSIGSVTTGANGYYYFLLPPAGTPNAVTISGSGSAVLVYSANGATVENATGSLSNFDIWGNTLIAPTADTTYATAKAKTLQVQDATLISHAVGSNAAAASFIAGLSNYGYIATGSAFNINSTLSLSNGLYIETIASGANITVSDPLSLPSREGLTLDAAGNIVISKAITGDGALTLNAAGTIMESGSTSITAASLTGSAGGATTLNGANEIASLGAFTDTGGNFALTDDESLTIAGALNTGAQGVTLNDTGTLAESTGSIDTATLAGSSTGGATLNGANQIGTLNAFTNTGGGGFALTDATTLTVNGALNGGTGNVALTTTGSGHSLVVDKAVTAGGSETLTSADNITVGSAQSWASSNTLTLDAAQSIAINASLTVTGAGALDLTTNGANGALTFGKNDSVVFDNLSSALTINGQAYTLVGNIATLAGDIAGNASGYYALANSYNATGDGTYTSSPVPTTFTGTLQGLGNSISNLTINDPTSGDDVGLFTSLGEPSVVDNLHLTSVNIQDAGVGAGGTTVGGLAAQSSGLLLDDSVSGNVSVGAGGNGNANVVGGLLGFSGGAQIEASYSTANVTGGVDTIVGGLVAEADDGTIANSYAVGTISGPTAGGLVGANLNDPISNSYSGGLVSGGAGGTAGGLVGSNGGTANSTIGDSYSTASVTGGFIGGLVASNNNNIIDSYATGTVTGGASGYAGGLVGENNSEGTINESYAIGTVKGGTKDDVGGLVGFNVGLVENSYATGSVTGGTKAYVGGAIGYNNSGTVSDSYGAGAVSGGTGSSVGGFTGFDYLGTYSDDYWDTTTSGITSLSQGVGNIANDADVTGLSTTQLQSGLPTGFDPAVWGENPSINGGLPYLLELP